jgi:hypothetical protein
MATELTQTEAVTAEPQVPPAELAAKKKPRSRKAAAPKRATKKSPKKKPSAKKVTRKVVATKRSGKKKVSTKARSKPAPAQKSAAKKVKKRKPAPMKRRTKKRKTTKPSSVNGINKSQAIRDAAKEIGGKPRPRDIIAALAARGITVVSAQVSTVLKAAGLRRGRRRKKSLMAVVAPKAASNGHALNIGELVKVKKLADEIGGTAKLKELATALERLA